MVLASVVFSRDYFTPRTSKLWLQKHHFKTPTVDVTENTLRYRQSPPVRDKRYYTKRISLGIYLVFHT